MCHLSSLFVDVSASTVPQRFQTEETKKKKKNGAHAQENVLERALNKWHGCDYCLINSSVFCIDKTVKLEKAVRRRPVVFVFISLLREMFRCLFGTITL